MDLMLPDVDPAGTLPARRSVLAALAIVSAVVFVTTGTACESSTSVALPAPVASAPATALVCLPVVSSISPRSGAGVGHTIVVITGGCFAAVKEVEFGTSAALTTKVDSGAQITATSPPGTGTVYVIVVTSAGKSADSALSQFTYKPSATLSPLAGKPPVSSLSPARASPGLWA